MHSGKAVGSVHTVTARPPTLWSEQCVWNTLTVGKAFHLYASGLRFWQKHRMEARQVCIQSRCPLLGDQNAALFRKKPTQCHHLPPGHWLAPWLTMLGGAGVSLLQADATPQVAPGEWSSVLLRQWRRAQLVLPLACDSGHVSIVSFASVLSALNKETMLALAAHIFLFQ